jgi:hypothetical protein
MRKEVYPTAEDLQELLDWYEDLNTSVIKLDAKYKTLGIAYHCIEPAVRDDTENGVTDVCRLTYEYARGGEAPFPIQGIRALDNIVINARFMARRGRWWDKTTLREGKAEAAAKLEDLERLMRWIEEAFARTETRDSTDRLAVVGGRGTARFDAMGSTQKSKFLLWASQMREVQIAKSRHLITSVRDIVELMMGEDERVVLEWPEVIPEPKEGVRPSAAGERRRLRRLNNEPERELRESHGAGAAFAFR